MRPYEARRRVLPEIVVFAPALLVLAGFLAVSGSSVALHEGPQPGDGRGYLIGFWSFLLLAALLVVATAGMALRWLVPALTHQVALRVDHNGVTLGPEPVPPARVVVVSWTDIEAVVVVQTTVTLGFVFPDRRRFVGLRLRPNALRPPGIPKPDTFRARLRKLNNYNRDWHGEVFRMVRGWRLDDASLQSAVQLHSRNIDVEYQLS